jgi:hypothetical protein
MLKIIIIIKGNKHTLNNFHYVPMSHNIILDIMKNSIISKNSKHEKKIKIIWFCQCGN